MAFDPYSMSADQMDLIRRMAQTPAQPIALPPSLGNPTPQQPQSLNQLVPKPSVAPTISKQTPAFTNESVPDSKTARGGFSGSLTDAEAQRNLLARAQQDQASDYMVNRYNSATNALRDLRAEKMGVSRSVLDSMEGRGTGLTTLAPSAPSVPGVFDRPGDSFGDAQMREAKFNTLLSDAASQKGLGAGKRAAAMTNAALGLLQPGLDAQKAAVEVYGKNMDAQTEQAKSLNDLHQRNQMTPYQQQSLALEQQKIGAIQGQQGAKKLEDLSGDLSKDPRYSNFIKAQNYMGMLQNQFNSKNPSDHARMSLTVQQLARPESEPNDYTTKVLEGSTGDIVDKVLGPVKQALGGSAYSEEQRKRLFETGKGSFEAKQAEGFAAINDAVNRIMAAGGDPRQYLNPSDLQFWQSYWQKQQGQGQQGAASYKWDGEKLVPVQ